MLGFLHKFIPTQCEITMLGDLSLGIPTGTKYMIDTDPSLHDDNASGYSLSNSTHSADF